MRSIPAAFLAALLVTAAARGAPPPAPEPACGEISGLAQLLGKRTVLVFGEMHGSRESPGFVGDVVCRALGSGLSVTLGLELLDGEAPGIATFLGSAGGEDDRRSLIAGGAWSAEYQDGRTSRAMLDLLDRVRRFRAAGKPVVVELFDRSGWRSGQERDVLMAQALAGVLESTSSDLVVVLTGNIHSRIGRGTPWDDAYQPMTFLLLGMTDWRLVALNVAHAGGAAWICNGSTPSSCGERQVGGHGRETGGAIELGDDPATSGHHGRYQVGPLNASPPARGAAATPSADDPA